MVVVDVVVWAKATATSSKRASTSRIVRRREREARRQRNDTKATSRGAIRAVGARDVRHRAAGRSWAQITIQS